MGLTLSRMIGETIKIGDNIYVTPIRIGDGFVKLDVVAPKEIPIIRTELDHYASDRKINKVNKPNNTKIIKACPDSVLGLSEQQDKQNSGTTG